MLGPGAPQRLPRETGVILLITLIFLVAMVMSSLALIRSVDTATLVAGNIALKQSVTQAGEIGIEAAIDSLEQYAKTGVVPGGYAPCIGTSDACSYPDTPAAGQSWADFWTAALEGLSPVQVPSADSTQPQVWFVIQRLCEDALGTVCAMPPYMKGTMSGDPGLISTGQRYYRITCKVVGVGRAVSYLQTVVLI